MSVHDAATESVIRVRPARRLCMPRSVRPLAGSAPSPRTWLGGVALLALLSLSLVAQSDAQAQPVPQRSAKAYEPSLRLTTQDGQSLRFYEDVIRGRIALINTMFTSCQAICPPITANLVKVQKALSVYLGKQVIMVSISVDPEVDTPTVLKRYAKRFEVGPGWIFLTGRPADVDAVLAKIGDGDPNKDRHSGMLLLGDDGARTWRKLPAMSDPSQIAAAVEKLLASHRATAPAASASTKLPKP